jgi:hypothetical protein
MANELTEVIEEMRQNAFEAKCHAAKAGDPEMGRFWNEVAAKWDGIADDYTRLRLRSLN